MRSVSNPLAVLLLFASLGCGNPRDAAVTQGKTDTSDGLQRPQVEPLPLPTGHIADLVKQLRSSDRKVAFDAATELGNIGPGAITAIPALVELATFDEKGSYNVHPGLAACDALPKISSEASIPYLEAALKHRSTRYWAAQVLGDLGTDARSTIPALVAALRDEIAAQTEDERAGSAKAADALAKIRPEGLSALIGEMGNDNTGIRMLAVRATPRGREGKPAVEALARRLGDSDQNIRRMAAIALSDIGPEAIAALPLLQQAKEKESNGFSRAAISGAINSIQADRRE